MAQNNLPCIIFTHFGLAEDRQIGNYWFEKNPEKGLISNRNEVKEIIKQDSNVIAIFYEIANKIKSNVGNIYLVGGAVRDNLLGIEKNDEDNCIYVFYMI